MYYDVVFLVRRGPLGLEGAGNRRKPQIFAENHRKPQIGLCHLRSITLSSGPIECAWLLAKSPGPCVGEATSLLAESNEHRRARYRPKGVLGKSVAASAMTGLHQKGVVHAPKCVRNASKMHQKCAEHFWPEHVLDDVDTGPET